MTTPRIPLFTQDVYDEAQSKTKFPFQCNWCLGIFYREKRFIKSKDKLQPNSSHYCYCSPQCHGKANCQTTISNCCQCQARIEIIPSEVSVSGRNFCSSSCAAIYNNTHKTKGYRRSKCEIWIESVLTDKYPLLNFEFNKKSIGSELDVYIPSLKLAFEINGIFHYQPIYGEKKFFQTQENDRLKLKQCHNSNIKLIIYDISNIKHFKPHKVQYLFDDMSKIINYHLSN